MTLAQQFPGQGQEGVFSPAEGADPLADEGQAHRDLPLTLAPSRRGERGIGVTKRSLAGKLSSQVQLGNQ